MKLSGIVSASIDEYGRLNLQHNDGDGYGYLSVIMESDAEIINLSNRALPTVGEEDVELRVVVERMTINYRPREMSKEEHHQRYADGGEDEPAEIYAMRLTILP